MIAAEVVKAVGSPGKACYGTEGFMTWVSIQHSRTPRKPSMLIGKYVIFNITFFCYVFDCFLVCISLSVCDRANCKRMRQ